MHENFLVVIDNRPAGRGATSLSLPMHVLYL